MSNEINMSSMLLQMRSMSDRASTGISPLQVNNQGLPAVAETMGVKVNDQATGKVEFSSLLKSAVQQVNAIQQQSGSLKNDFVSGKEGVDLVQVMIASEKSSVAFGAMVEVRNKLLKAYDEVKRIRV